MRGEASHDLDDLRHPVGDVGETAGEHAHLVTVTVHLDAGAVELVLHGGLAGGLDRVCGRRRGRGEHRQHGAADEQPHGRELVLRAGERDDGGLAEITRQHRRAAHHGGGAARRTGHGVEEHATEGAGAQLAEDRAREEVPLLGGRASGEVRQETAAGGSGACSGRRRECVERGVDLVDGEGGYGRVLDGDPGDAPPPDPQPPLSRRREEEADERRDLRRRRLGEERGERLDLREPRPRGRDRTGRVDHVSELHHCSLAPASDIRPRGHGGVLRCRCRMPDWPHDRRERSAGPRSAR